MVNEILTPNSQGHESQAESGESWVTLHQKTVNALDSALIKFARWSVTEPNASWFVDGAKVYKYVLNSFL
jgi:hypothetical protein